VQDVHSRAEVLAALEAVDLVAVFGEDTPLKLIERVRPQVLVKGGDYRREDVVGHDLVEAAGGETVLVDLVPGHSTSALVRRSAPPAKPGMDTGRERPKAKSQGKMSAPASAAKPAPVVRKSKT
jgi:glycerol-3-phosphate cytidylyltransferase-like family protein